MANSAFFSFFLSVKIVISIYFFELINSANLGDALVIVPGPVRCWKFYLAPQDGYAFIKTFTGASWFGLTVLGGGWEALCLLLYSFYGTLGLKPSSSSSKEEFPSLLSQSLSSLFPGICAQVAGEETDSQHIWLTCPHCKLASWSVFLVSMKNNKQVQKAGKRCPFLPLVINSLQWIGTRIFTEHVVIEHLLCVQLSGKS